MLYSNQYKTTLIYCLLSSCCEMELRLSCCAVAVLFITFTRLRMIQGKFIIIICMYKSNYLHINYSYSKIVIILCY